MAYRHSIGERPCSTVALALLYILQMGAPALRYSRGAAGPLTMISQVEASLILRGRSFLAKESLTTVAGFRHRRIHGDGTEERQLPLLWT